MKKLIWILLVTMSALLLSGYFFSSQAQKASADSQGVTKTSLAKEENKTTFPKSTPGLYVSGWPSFTLAYPSDWTELTPEAGQVFRVGAPEPIPLPSLTISVFSSLLPLDQSTKMIVPAFGRIGEDVRVMYEKPSQLKDGVPAYEAELEWVPNLGPKLNTLLLTTRKDDVWIVITVSDKKGTIGEDLKGIANSLKIKPGKEELLKVPADIQEFLNKFSSDVIDHDIEKVMHHYSDQFLNYGRNKQAVEDYLGNAILGITSYEVNITGFESQGDKAYLTGFASGNFGKVPLPNSFIIKENGQWKWYGNQK
jgi:hypothetical protein